MYPAQSARGQPEKGVSSATAGTPEGPTDVGMAQISDADTDGGAGDAASPPRRNAIHAEYARGLLPGGPPEYPCGKGKGTTSDAKERSPKTKAQTTNVADADVLSAPAGASESDGAASSRVPGGAKNTWPLQGETSANFSGDVFYTVSPHIGIPPTLRG